METYRKTLKEDVDEEVAYDFFRKDIKKFKRRTFNSQLSLNLETKFEQMGTLPTGGSGIDQLNFDGIQFQRLVSLNTQKRCCIEEICYPSKEVETLMTTINGSLLGIMQEILFDDGEKETTKTIQSSIMSLFVDEESAQHDESDTDYKLQQFRELAKHQPSQDAFAAQLLSWTFIIYQYADWETVLADPKKLQKLGLIFETFSFETRSKFFKRLAKIML